MFKIKPIYEYLGECNDLLNARASLRCGQTVTPCRSEETGGGGEPVFPFEIGEPFLVPFSVPVKTLDCQVLDANNYVIAAVTNTSGSNERVLLVLGEVGTGSTQISFGPEFAVSGPVNRVYGWVSVTVLSPTHFVVFFSTRTTPDGVYYTVCNILPDRSVTSGTTKLLVSTNFGTDYIVYSLRARGRSNTLVVLYRPDTSGNEPVVASATVSGDTVTMGTPSPLGGASDISPGTAFMCDSHFDDYYKIIYYRTGITVSLVDAHLEDNGDVTLGTPVTIFSTIDETFSRFCYRVVPFDNGTDFVSLAQLAGSRGASIKVSNFDASVIRDYIGTPSQGTVIAGAGLASVGAKRLFYVHGTDTTSDELKIEAYRFDGSKLNIIDTYIVHTLKTIDPNTIRMSSLGFSPTKTAMAYIGRDPTQPAAYTIIGEAGDL